MDRILMVTPYLHSQRGNSVTATRLFTGLRRKGYAIDLISMDEPDWEFQLDCCFDINCYSLVHGYHARQFSRVVNHPLIKNIPILLTTTGTDINCDLLGPLSKQTLETMFLASKIVVFNPHLGKQITAIEPRLQSRQVVIPQGVELPSAPLVTRHQLGLSLYETVFVLPSGLRPIKNIDLALDGLEIVYQQYPHLRLLIVGAAIDVNYTAHLKSRLSTLNWAHYFGEIPHQKMKGILQIADIVLNTSHAEGQPQGALEAMYLGKPCILTAVPGNLDIIMNGIQGYYINSPAELAAAALKLIQNPSLRYAMGNQARQLITKKYAVELEINAYDRLYKTLNIQPLPEYTTLS
ncbi:Alpha-monoglucosyldiacylglycerol synthase [Sporotomaculum syntrophicum]|uniref:Alpha-monoglucosyldiacylglycerol synthase n=1 Tax=Sporotomaculum syntrophicum TaxID=182264 RepID=A0A9D2WPJ0_9FIRM|nr:glycosyltransferase [Sporotomaculum syntrophicum]KAF1084723.1 Alpha-monoglucosyldiacylglycerol synthase [Sporotomaculum syntrophicum]